MCVCVNMCVCTHEAIWGVCVLARVCTCPCSLETSKGAFRAPEPLPPPPGGRNTGPIPAALGGILAGVGSLHKPEFTPVYRHALTIPPEPAQPREGGGVSSMPSLMHN